LDVIELLLENQQLNLAAVNDAGETPLMKLLGHASDLLDIERRQVGIEQLCRDAQLSSRRTTNGDTVLHLITLSDDAQTIAKYTEATLWTATNGNGNTPLQVACMHGRVSVVRVYLDTIVHRHCIHAAQSVDDADRTLLHFACQNGHAEVAKLLLTHSAFSVQWINEKMNRGNTALHLAAQSNHTDTIQVLLDHGANTNLRNGQDKTAADSAIEATQMLIDGGFLLRCALF
jgi:ankyrin repeat protein